MSAMDLTRLQRLTYRVWLAVGVVVLLGASFWLLYRPLAVVLAPLLVALIIVYLLNPIVEELARRRVPRLAGAALAYLIVASVLTGLSGLLVPLLAQQLTGFAEAAPDLSVTLKQRLTELVGFFGLDIDVAEAVSTAGLVEGIQEFLTSGENREAVVAILTGLSGLARGAFFVVYTVLVGPVIAFYILADLPRLLVMGRRVLPPQYRQEVAQVSQRLGRVVGGFIRGQLIIATFVGVATWIALALIGLPFSLLVGVIAGVTNLVPLLGPFVAGVLAVSLALVSDGIGFALLVVAVMTGIQQLESSVLNPLIMGRSVRIHPLIVLLGVIVAGALYGVFGMLVVVPLVAGAKVLLAHLWYTRVPWAEPLDAPDARAGDATAVLLEGAERSGAEAEPAREPAGPRSGE